MAYHKRRLRNVKPRVLLTHDEEGELVKLVKRVNVKVIIQGKIQHHKFVAPAGKGYSSQDIYDIRERCVNFLDHRFPHFEFSEVRIAEDAYNYIATELRPGAQEVIDGQFAEVRKQIERTLAAGGSGAKPTAAGRQLAEQGSAVFGVARSRQAADAEQGSAEDLDRTGIYPVAPERAASTADAGSAAVVDGDASGRDPVEREDGGAAARTADPCGEGAAGAGEQAHSGAAEAEADPVELQTESIAKKVCKFKGHWIEPMVVRSSSPVPDEPGTPQPWHETTVVICRQCGASLIQIRG